MSRFRSVAPAIGLVLVLTACGTATTSPSAATPAPTSQPSAAPPASAAPSSSAAAARRQVQGRQRQHPDLQRSPGRGAAAAARTGLGAADRRPRQRRRRRFPDDLRQGAARRVDRDQQLRRLRLRPAVDGRLRRARLPAGPDRSGQRRHHRSTGRTSARSSATSTRRYNGKVYTIPLDGDFHMVYYRKRHPDQGRRQAAGNVGRLPDDRAEVQRPGPQRRRHSRTTARASPRRRAPRATGGSSRSPAACSRAKGTNEGAFFDTTNMNPLFGQNEAMTKALETYKKTAEFGPPDELNHGRRRHARPVHDRSLRADDGLGRHRHARRPGTYAQDKTGATITPGWKQVLDRDDRQAGRRATRRPARMPSTA